MSMDVSVDMRMNVGVGLNLSLDVNVDVSIGVGVSVRMGVSVSVSVGMSVGVGVGVSVGVNVGVNLGVQYAKLEKNTRRAAASQPLRSRTAAARQLKRLQSALKLEERNPTLIASGNLLFRSSSGYLISFCCRAAFSRIPFSPADRG